MAVKEDGRFAINAGTMEKRRLLEEVIMIELLAVLLHRKRSAWDMALLYYNIALLNFLDFLSSFHMKVYFSSLVSSWCGICTERDIHRVRIGVEFENYPCRM